MTQYTIVECRYKMRMLTIEAANIDSLRKKLLDVFNGGSMWVYDDSRFGTASLVGMITWDPIIGKIVWYNVSAPNPAYAISEKTGKIRRL